MSITTTTHLNFRGTAGQALEFYRSVFGGTVTAATYGDYGMPKEAPDAGKILFGQLENADGFRLMAYDVPGPDAAGTAGAAGTADAAGTAGTAGTAGSTRRENGTTITDLAFFQSLRGQSLEEMATLWDALADGGEIIEPLAASAWSPGFGMLTDRFGVTWVIDVEAPGDR